jgi:predicted ester cyclase
VDELLTDSYVRHDPNSPEVQGPEEEKRLIAMYRAAFPDLRFTVEDMVAEDDRVATRIGISTTHEGELLGVPPTQRQLSFTAMELYRLAEGRIEEQWVNVDTLGMMPQLGAIPAP